MRDPATRIDPVTEITEAAIEYARSTLKPWVVGKKLAGIENPTGAKYSTL